MTTKTQLYLHNHKKHNNHIEKPSKIQRLSSESHFDIDYESQDNYQSLDISLPVGLQKITGLGSHSFNNFKGLYNRFYFQNQHFGSLGAAYLVGNSMFHDAESAKNIEKDEVAMHLNVASLVCTLTRSQRDQLAVILDQVTTAAVNQFSAEASEKVWSTKIPRTPGDIRNLYVRGKFAILPNLPRPPVLIVGDHGYVSLKDCVADLLGHGLEVDNVVALESCSVVSKVSESAAAQKMLQNVRIKHSNAEKVLCLYIIEWSDAFEPSSCTKNNRGSCWIKTITIAPPSSKNNRLTHTYPVSLGLDGDSHEEIEAMFSAELEAFKNGVDVTFYHGGIKQNVLVYLELIASLQDQPERRKSNYIMLGGGKFTSRWGYSLDIAAVASNVPACAQCCRMNLNGGSFTQQCSPCVQCVNWDTYSSHELLKVTPPKDYPEEHIPPTNVLSPLQLSYDLLKAAVKNAHNGFCSGEWSKKNVDSYLRVHGLNNDAINSVIECATNAKLFHDIDTDPEKLVDPDKAAFFEQIVAKRNKHPQKYMMWKFPPQWTRGVNLSQHIDVPMHLVFLGVVKTVIQMVQEWAKLRGKYATFVRYLHGTLDSIQQLGLDWCRCVPYKNGKLGGWVSENYLAAARLLPWMYCCLDTLAADITFVTPTKEQKKWTMKENQQWLQIRGLETAGNAQQLRERVKTMIDRVEGPPPYFTTTWWKSRKYC